MYPLSRMLEKKNIQTPRSHSHSPSLRTQIDTNSYILLLESAQLNALMCSAPISWLVGQAH